MREAVEQIGTEVFVYSALERMLSAEDVMSELETVMAGIEGKIDETYAATRRPTGV